MCPHHTHHTCPVQVGISATCTIQKSTLILCNVNAAVDQVRNVQFMRRSIYTRSCLKNHSSRPKPRVSGSTFHACKILLAHSQHENTFNQNNHDARIHTSTIVHPFKRTLAHPPTTDEPACYYRSPQWIAQFKTFSTASDQQLLRFQVSLARTTNQPSAQ